MCDNNIGDTMKNIMYFSLNKSKYLIYMKDDNINIARIVKKKMELPNKFDSGIIREVIDAMCHENLNMAILASRIKLIDPKKAKVKNEENVTTLSFIGDTRTNFLKNCDFIYQKSLPVSKIILFIILIVILLVGIFLGYKLLAN